MRHWNSDSLALRSKKKSVLDYLHAVKKCLIEPLSVLCEVIEALLAANPDGAATQDGDEALPLHHAAEGAWASRAVVAEAPWSVAEWAVAPRFDIPQATVLVLVLG